MQKQRYEEKLAEKTSELNSMNDGEEAQKSAQAFNAIQNDYQVNKEEVIKMLIGNIVNVNIEIPRVVKGDFEAHLDK